MRGSVRQVSRGGHPIKADVEQALRDVLEPSRSATVRCRPRMLLAAVRRGTPA